MEQHTETNVLKQYQLIPEQQWELPVTQLKRLRAYKKARRDEREEIIGQFHLVPKIEGINNHIIPEDPPSDQNERQEKIKLLTYLLKKYKDLQGIEGSAQVVEASSSTAGSAQVVEESSSTARRKNKKLRKIS